VIHRYIWCSSNSTQLSDSRSRSRLRLLPLIRFLLLLTRFLLLILLAFVRLQLRCTSQSHRIALRERINLLLSSWTSLWSGFDYASIDKDDDVLQSLLVMSGPVGVFSPPIR